MLKLIKNLLYVLSKFILQLGLIFPVVALSDLMLLRSLLSRLKGMEVDLRTIL